MSSNRKSNNELILRDYKQIFNKNVSKYFAKIIIELSKGAPASNESGAELKNFIKEKKQSLNNTAKKEIGLPPIREDERQFKIPTNWIWCRLGDISINCDSARIPVSQAVREKREKIYDYYGASGVIDKIDGYTHEGKHLLIGEDGANLKAKSTPIAFIVEGKFWVNNHAHVLRFIDDITYKYMEYCLNMIDINPYLSGGFQPKLSQKNLNSIPIPLPPLVEQELIVKFLTDFENHELCANGSYLNKDVENKAIELHNLQELGYRENLEHLCQLDYLKKLRQQILQDAVQGKLVHQSPNDEPATLLLKRIKVEKEKLVWEKKIKKEKPLPPINQEEIPFEIPDSWVWCRIGEVAQHNSGKTLDSGRNTGKPRKCLTTSNLYWGFFDVELVKTIQIEDNELDRCTARKGDLLVCEGGDAGRAAIWDHAEVICFQNHLHRIRFYGKINTSLGYWYFLHLNLSGRIENYRKGMGISNLSGKSLSMIVFPLPPLNEQYRILKKIEQLMTLCDELEQSIHLNQKYIQDLLLVTLNEALETKKIQRNKSIYDKIFKSV